MTDQTVPDFSIEHYVEKFRRDGEDSGNLFARAIGAVEGTLNDLRIDDTERCRQIRNVIAAADVVLAERRCPPECAQNWKAASDPLTHVAHCPNAPDDNLGLTYSRTDDDPQVVRPHSPRVPAHAALIADGGSELLAIAPAADGGVAWAMAPAGTVVDPVARAKAVELTEAVAANPPVDEAPASGLTPAADLSRGVLAGTTPVVTYFSFGHGQTDPDTGQDLLDHYVTVVAPTYDECREAMFASRFGRAWSFDYLAGRAKTTEWVSRWTEHEVIIAPGTDLDAAEKALTAAADLLQIDGAR